MDNDLPIWEQYMDHIAEITSELAYTLDPHDYTSVQEIECEAEALAELCRKQDAIIKAKGKEIIILEAASEYYRALSKNAIAKLTPITIIGDK